MDLLSVCWGGEARRMETGSCWLQPPRVRLSVKHRRRGLEEEKASCSLCGRADVPSTLKMQLTHSELLREAS